jgi:hypothetical protein
LLKSIAFSTIASSIRMPIRTSHLNPAVISWAGLGLRRFLVFRGEGRKILRRYGPRERADEDQPEVRGSAHGLFPNVRRGIMIP